MNKFLLLGCFVYLAIYGYAQTRYAYWVEGNITVAMQLTYSDIGSVRQTDTSWSIKTKTVKITTATVINAIAVDEGITGRISKSAQLIFVETDADSPSFFIRDPKGLGTDYDVSSYFRNGPILHFAEAWQETYNRNGILIKSSGSGKDLSTLSFTTSSLRGTLTGLSTFSTIGSCPKDNINFPGIYYCDTEIINLTGGDDTTKGVFTGIVISKEKLVKSKVTY